MSQKPAKKSFVAYYRVSTDRQGKSGLGLEAQRESVRQYVNGHGELVAEYTEVESGKRSDRSQLMKAINHSRGVGATLVIAKLDRLSRNVRFTATLMESGANFVAVDMPEANKLTIHILAAVAEDEARRISQRTKDALAAYRARGGKLGSHHHRCKNASIEASRKGSLIGGRAMRQRARDADRHVEPLMASLRNEGKSLRQIAAELNEQEFLTRNGRAWTATQVKRVLDRRTQDC